LVYQKLGVTAKMNKNEYFYPAGFVTTDDSWVNLLAEHPTIDFGWRGKSHGVGLKSYARMLADSKAFSRCMVQRVFSAVCRKSIQSAAAGRLHPLADDFESNRYNLKYLFAKVAMENACISHP
jgi:hypothetical protein